MPRDEAEARRKREATRRNFRPAQVKLLFIGESPPASGRFFYNGDSGLFRAMRDAFRVVEPSLTDAAFLPFFQTSGCYLVDLSLDPVDHLDSKSRRAACRAGEEFLARTIAELQPALIATVVRSIEANASRAAKAANWHGPFLHLPYPGRWSRFRLVFVETLGESLAERYCTTTLTGVLATPPTVTTRG